MAGWAYYLVVPNKAEELLRREEDEKVKGRE